MTIDIALISRLEHLARLELSEAERKSLLKDLNEILAMVAKMDELDTTGVDPLVYVTEEVNVLRADDIEHQVDRKSALMNAPDHNEEYFKVPKVIDK